MEGVRHRPPGRHTVSTWLNFTAGEGELGLSRSSEEGLTEYKYYCTSAITSCGLDIVPAPKLATRLGQGWRKWLNPSLLLSSPDSSHGSCSTSKRVRRIIGNTVRNTHVLLVL